MAVNQPSATAGTVVERNLFYLLINPISGWAAPILLQIEPSHRVMDVARRLSLAYPGQRVTVEMFARNRRVYVDGEIESSTPDLHHFYESVEGQDQWDWTCCGAEKE